MHVASTLWHCRLEEHKKSSKDRIALPYIVTWMGLAPGFERITLRHWWWSQEARDVGLAGGVSPSCWSAC